MPKSMFAAPPEVNREKMDLANFLPDGFSSLQEVDDFNQQLIDKKHVIVCEIPIIRSAMELLKKTQGGRTSFRNISEHILGPLVLLARRETELSGNDLPVKSLVSVRAGLAFLPHLERHLPEAETGFLTQTRDEASEALRCISSREKVGSFVGRQAIVVDPMLATGGSMEDLVDAAIEEGAESVVTVSAFSAPQGIARIGAHPGVSKIITTPLEAGLNDKGYIVGGQEEFSMLGDFGDRRFGDVDQF